MQIPLDIEAVEKQIAADAVLLSLQAKRQRWVDHQTEKRRAYAERVKGVRDQVKELQREARKLQLRVRAKLGEISRLKSFGSFKYAGLRQIDKRIADRRRHLKQMAIAKAAAEAQRAAMKEWNRNQTT